MTDDKIIEGLLARIERLETRAARAEERAARAARAVELDQIPPDGPPLAPAQAGDDSPSRLNFLRSTGLKAAGAAAAGALIFGTRQPETARAAASGLPVYNAQTYGAKGDGATDDTSAINAAIADAASAGGGVVYLPAGTYRISPHPHPQNGVYAPCILMRRGVALRGAGKGATTLRLIDNAALPSGSALICLSQNYTINAGSSTVRDEDMVVEDLAVDGNAAKQSVPTYGIFWIGCHNVYHNRVRVANVYGTGSSGGGIAETFFYEFQLGSEVFYSFCEAATTDGGSTASGFSTDNATGVSYVGCVVHGVKFSSGFTHNTCAILRYAECHSYVNGLYGFNSEVSEDVRYTGCVAGARADAAGQGTFTANQSLGNVNAGFVLNGSRVIDLTGCSSRYNGYHGLWVVGGADSVRVLGGEYANNSGVGIATTSDVTNLSISHETRLAGNAAGSLAVNSAVNTATPFLYDSGWIAPSGDTITVSHGLPNRPRAVTVYVGPSPAPSDGAAARTYTDPIYVTNAQVSVKNVSSGDTYRVIALY